MQRVPAESGLRSASDEHSAGHWLFGSSGVPGQSLVHWGSRRVDAVSLLEHGLEHKSVTCLRRRAWDQLRQRRP